MLGNRAEVDGRYGRGQGRQQLSFASIKSKDKSKDTPSPPALRKKGSGSTRWPHDLAPNSHFDILDQTNAVLR